jgi:hypothetical protein
MKVFPCSLWPNSRTNCPQRDLQLQSIQDFNFRMVRLTLIQLWPRMIKMASEPTKFGHISRKKTSFKQLCSQKASTDFSIPYTRHYNPLVIRNRSWILTIHKDRIFWKNLLEKTFLASKKWVKNIQTVGYNGASTVYSM